MIYIKKLKETFFCGQGEAAYYLSQFYYNGWSVKKDIIKGDFILSIGKKCGDQNCMVLDYKNDSLSMLMLLSKVNEPTKYNNADRTSTTCSLTADRIKYRTTNRDSWVRRRYRNK
ncbi:hypothetical protein MCC_04425 [Rickettsia rhipicephali str. 3-7-female6-CWPP]|uniref:Uncharacterized protein n=1 Tax=Rickettsia rhipicephali (strain 3-7-female6-CWPP) TaxID=1105113 RepID=A0AAI8AA11_RICR3|nr:hypothetical protein [Rickettsia rhipicephali]AFC72441.1 hypothetical protein MCC_04425 [Rickettsia rhipicephali str. 3-7-female6-CWPP]